MQSQYLIHIFKLLVDNIEISNCSMTKPLGTITIIYTAGIIDDTANEFDYLTANSLFLNLHDEIDQNQNCWWNYANFKIKSDHMQL